MQQDIAIAVKNQLEEVMQEYGYQILQALVTDMDPDQRVKGAMNEINASKRLREAATNKAEADKIMQVCCPCVAVSRSLVLVLILVWFSAPFRFVW